MEEKITAFINDMISYDYILFGTIFVLFILFIVLGLILRNKVALSIFLITLSFSTLLFGSTLGYIKMHEFLFKNETQLISQKRLEFMEAVVVKGTLTNVSKYDFQSCKISANAYKVSGNSIKDFIFQFNSFKNMSIVEHNVLKGEQREFKIIMEPFSYQKDYNISLGAKCK